MVHQNNIYPVILSGGVGTRLWPKSRKDRPKQFVELVENKTLFSTTLERAACLTSNDPLVITNEDHRFLVAEELRNTGKENQEILLEPMARNTAPAACVAALKAMEMDKEAVILIMPSDHYMPEIEKFNEAVQRSLPHVQNSQIVAFGKKPTTVETGYGYIKLAEQSSNRIEQFVEKPDFETAKKFFQSGDYFWNIGIFITRADTFLETIKSTSPAIYEACVRSYESLTKDGDFLRLNKEEFFKCPSDSIDYAVMEKVESSTMIEYRDMWNDLGSWDALWALGEKDKHGNVAHGDIELMDTNNSYIESKTKLVTVLGCDNLIVVEDGDSILIADMSRSQDVKVLVEELRKDGRTEADINSRVYRPWGNYEGIDTGERYQVKRITVKPHAQLSLQMHHHRAEHWVVVKGTALVTCGSEQKMLGENESTYIPFREIHRLENPGNIPLELIEIQSGSYLGEDDIVRFEDIYGRSKGKDDSRVILKSA